MGAAWTRNASVNWPLQVRFIQITRYSAVSSSHPNILYYALCIFYLPTEPKCGQGSSVGIAADHGLDLDGPGIESRWGEIFRPSRPALGPTQPPVQWVLGLSRGWSTAGRVLLTTHPLLVPCMEEYSYTSTHPLGHNRACNGNTLLLPFYRAKIWLTIHIY